MRPPRRLAARILVPFALALVLVVPTPSPAPAHGPRVWWTHAYPFGDTGRYVVGYESVKGPRTAFYLPSVDSSWSVRRFVWRGWGSARAVGRGQAHYCDSRGCSRWRSAKIVLTTKYRFDCAHGSDPSAHDYHWTYRRSQVWGFAGFAGGATRTVPVAVARC